ncbi:MAG: hypothetical protein KUG64_10795 [Cycloclasticus sp.]|nr:hypothetical protein [Cycloclasticus sp.]
MEYLVTERTAECNKLGWDVDFCGGAEDEAHYANYAPPKKYIFNTRKCKHDDPEVIEDKHEFPTWEESQHPDFQSEEEEEAYWQEMSKAE